MDRFSTAVAINKQQNLFIAFIFKLVLICFLNNLPYRYTESADQPYSPTGLVQPQMYYGEVCAKHNFNVHLDLLVNLV